MNCYKFKSGFNVKLFLILMSVLLLVSYGLFNARNIILGPTIELFNPSRDSETSESVLTIKGRAKNTDFISLNQKQIFVDTEGIFEDKLLLSPGSNIIEIKAKDRFKNEVVKTVRIYYKESPINQES